MSSGLSVSGTTGRCYGFFQDFLACETNFRKQIYTGKKDGELIRSCKDQHEDYFECLHNRKENARLQTVLAEKKRQGL